MFDGTEGMIGLIGPAKAIASDQPNYRTTMPSPKTPSGGLTPASIAALRKLPSMGMRPSMALHSW